LTADGAYDRSAVNEALERIAAVGRRQWRKESGAHRQARAENGMCRYKLIIGDRLRARRGKVQQREALAAVSVTNRLMALGTPDGLRSSQPCLDCLHRPEPGSWPL
jgi:hypothetical protein